MVLTGLTTGLSWVTLFLPLLPALIIIFRQKWQQPINGCILGFCLLNSTHHFLLHSQQFSKHDTELTNAIANLTEWLLLFWIFKLETVSKWLKQLMQFFLISFSSVTLTILFLEGAERYAFPLMLIESCTLILMAIYLLLQLVRDRDIIIFQTQDFWIAGSIICNFGMQLFLEGLIKRNSNLSLNVQDEKELILALVNVVSFILLSVAASMNRNVRNYYT